MADKTAQQLESGVQIVSAIPGRVRLRASGSDRETNLNAIEQALEYQNGIREINTNASTGSAIVSFDPIALPLPYLLELLQQHGVAKTSALAGTKNQTDPLEPWKSTAYWKKQGRSFLPLIVGLVVARGLGLFGWRSLLAYMVAASATRQLLELVDSDPSPEIESVPALIPQSPQRQMKERGEKIHKEESPKILPFSKEMSTVVSSFAIAYTIVHAIPGRVRFQVPRIAEDPQYERRLQKLIEAAPGVTSVRSNSTAASIVINYDIRVVSPGVMRSRLSELIQEADSDKPPTVDKFPPPPPAPPANIQSESDAKTDAETQPAAEEVDNKTEAAIAEIPIPQTALEEADIEKEEAIELPQVPQPIALEADEKIPKQTESLPVMESALLEADIYPTQATSKPLALQAAVLKADIETDRATKFLLALQPVVLETNIETEEVSESQPVMQPIVLEIDTETEEVSESQPGLQPVVLEIDTETEEITAETEEIIESQRALQPAALEVNMDALQPVEAAKSETQPVEQEPVNLWYCLWQTVRSTIQSLRAGQPPMNALITGLRDAGAIPS